VDQARVCTFGGVNRSVLAEFCGVKVVGPQVQRAQFLNRVEAGAGPVTCAGQLSLLRR
jgi:hypothetical protein